MTARRVSQDAYYRDVRMVPFDLVKEFAIATAVVGVLVLVASLLLSSPDVPSLTIQRWATDDPVDFATTATAELAGTSESAQYGPPYTDGSNSVQSIGPLAPQQWFGDALHLDTASAFVLDPLRETAGRDPSIADALQKYTSAGDTTRQGWLDAYAGALQNATANAGKVSVAAGSYGPVPTLVDRLLSIAQNGGLDGLLLTSPRFYQTNYTGPLLFMGDGGRLADLAQEQHLLGNQWGMMNETGSYPGQTWLWLYTFWYQIPPFNSSSNADLLVVLVMAVLTALLALVPFIPILRDIPRWIPVHRLIWRNVKDSGGPLRDMRGGPAG